MVYESCGKTTIVNIPRIRSDKLVSYERQKSHDAGAFDGAGEFPLVKSADPASALRCYPRLRIDKALQKVSIFVVDNFDIRGTEIALLGGNGSIIGWSAEVHHRSCSVKHKIRKVFRLV